MMDVAVPKKKGPVKRAHVMTLLLYHVWLQVANRLLRLVKLHATMQSIIK